MFETKALIKSLKHYTNASIGMAQEQDKYRVLRDVLTGHGDKPFWEAYKIELLRNPRHQVASYMFQQFYGDIMFREWVRNSSEVYDPNPDTYASLLGEAENYTILHNNEQWHRIKEHPVESKPFRVFALRHPNTTTITILGWMDKALIDAVPLLPEWKKFKTLRGSVQDRLMFNAYQKGLSHHNAEFFFCEYHLCLVLPNGKMAFFDEHLKKHPEQANIPFDLDTAPSPTQPEIQWGWYPMPTVTSKRSRMTYNPESFQRLLAHFNLLTCLQNPKTVVVSKTKHKPRELRKAMRKGRPLLQSKTLLVQPETLQQINPLREPSTSTGRTHSYQYERRGGGAKKWILQANLETGMEVIAKKPRKNGDGFLYLVQGKRKGAVCNAHLPLKEKTVQTVKVKSFSSKG